MLRQSIGTRLERLQLDLKSFCSLEDEREKSRGLGLNLCRGCQMSCTEPSRIFLAKMTGLSGKLSG
jgi:hypothetical protein